MRTTRLVSSRAIGFAFAALLSFSTFVVHAENPRKTNSQPVAPSAQSLASVGLASLQPQDDQAGEHVRGMAYGRGGGRSSGMSFVAGMLYDPVSSSVIHGSNSNSTAALGGRAEVAQISGLQLAMTIQTGSGTVFNGSLTGLASGHGLAKP